MTAVQILSDAAKVNPPTLRELQNLARGVVPPALTDSSCGSKESVYNNNKNLHIKPDSFFFTH